MTLREILDRVASGTLSAEDAERHLSGWGLASVGFHRIDTHRGGRTSVPEVVFGLRKPAGDLLEIEFPNGRRSLIPFRDGIADLDDGRIAVDREFLA